LFQKSERFEFVDDKSVQSLSSDEDSETELTSSSVFRPKTLPSASKNLFTFFTINLRYTEKDTEEKKKIDNLLPEIQDPSNIYKGSGLDDAKLSERYQLIPTTPTRFLFDLTDQITGQPGDKEKFIVILERRTVKKIGYGN
jgi:hypothetical protein